MVSGGVSLENVQNYVAAGVTGICLGSSYLATLMEGGGKRFMTEIKSFVKLVAAAEQEETRLGAQKK
jgi:2-keto-3-deoxy-6-phosphogluconate aldolase